MYRYRPNIPLQLAEKCKTERTAAGSVKQEWRESSIQSFVSSLDEVLKHMASAIYDIRLHDEV